MPRYFFHIRSDKALLEDRTGLDLASPTAALEEAIESARDILADKVRSAEEIGHEQFEIVDEEGEPVHILPFRAVLRLKA